ncbi:dipeptide ABC transporter ATP-binding protein [Amycolatopsis sp. CA-126428]|uniref:dipeptide ABC transporter ATP-binding protein n=1 Tax=Amycolatopsis sp. CA-126428 TaxID=2073158 RepID=UPI000CD2944B|nr:ABC transporter ATP-binding protein [Amycolatopsis sp. CA-126428]
MTLLSIDGLRVAYGDQIAVDGVSLDLEPGRITAVVGESGSGKSTLAHAIIGLLPGTGKVLAGSIRLDGEELVGLREKAWRSVRGRRIGLVPQDPGVALDPTKPVGRQVAEVLKVHGLPGGPRVVKLLAEAGLPEPEVRARQYPHELSGGMRQRVLIAMATAARPRLLVADEPTSALDVTVQRRILDHLEHLANTTGTAILLVTHDLAVAAERAQRIVVMHNARVVEAGPAEQILHAPGDPYTRRLLSDNPATAGPRPRPAGQPEVLLEVRGLRKTFPVRGGGLRKQHRVAVDGVSFDVPRGQTLGLVGESGSGKTTTARLVLGLERPTAGIVRLGDTDVTGAGRAQLRRLHRRIQLIYQNPYSSLNPRFTVRDLLTEPLRNFGITDGPGATELLDSVALPAATAARKAAELSGGQRQRVAIARALSLNPELVVCDEPVSALDVTVQAQILDLLVTLQRDRGLSYLFISHDLAVVRQISDRIAVMRHGRIVETGATEDVFTAARHPYTRSLLDAVPGITEEEASWT